MYAEWRMGILYKHIGVGFALLVQLYRAMREPQDVGRATGSDLHAFFVYSYLDNLLNADTGGSISKVANNMKKTPFLITFLVITFLLSTACTKATTNQSQPSKKIDFTAIQPDKKVKEILGDTITNIIFSPRTVTVYELDAMSTPSDNDRTIGGVKVSKEIGKLDKSYYSIMQFLLADSCTYAGERIVPAVPNKPVMALEFAQKKEIVGVIFSFLSREITFVYNGKEIMRKQISNNRNMLLFFNNITEKKDIQFYLQK